jgi:WD40 repeat protein
LAGWIDGQREDLVLRARLAAGVADWEAAGRAESHLLTGGILSQHETWTADTELLLTATERQFLDASRKSENARLEERRRTRRAVMVGFGAAAVIALVLAVAATVAWNRARERAAAAKAGQLVAASTVELDRDPELGLLLAIEANEIAPPTADSDAALRRALFQHRGILTHELPRGGVPGGDLSPDGTLLAVAGHSSGLVEAIAVDTGSERWRYDLGERVSVYQPFFVDGGRQLVVPAFWTGPGTPPDMVAGLHVLDASSGEVVRFLDVGECGVFDAGTRASGDEYVYATVPDCGRTVSVITDVIGGTDTPDDLPIVRIDLADGAATTISDTWAFRMDASADETRIAMTTRDSEGELLSVTDTMTGEVLFELRDDFSEQIATLAPDGRLLVYEEFPSGDLIVVDLASGRQVTRYFGHRFDVTNVWFADDGDAVYSAGRDGTLQVWDPTTGATLERIPFGDAAISAAVSDDLTRVVVFSGTSTVKVYDFDHGGRIVGRSYDPVAPLDDCDFRFNQSFSLQVVGNTATMLAVCFADWDDGYQPFRLVTFDVTTGEPLRDHTPALGINSRLSPDGSTVAGLTAGSDGFSEALEIIDVTQGEAIVAMAGLCGVDFLRNPAPGCADYPETPFADGGALQFGPAGAELAMAGSVTNAVVVWDTRSGDIVTTRRADGELLGVAYSPDGSQLLVGTSDGLTAYSTDDWSVVGKRSWRGESGTAPGQLLAFTSDGARLVAASSDRLGGGSDVFVLDPASLETIARIEQPQNGALRMLDVSRDDRRLATAGTDGFARVWDIETLELVAELPISEDAVTNIQFADNDRKLLVTTQESDLIVVDLESEAALDLARGRLTRSFTRTECRIHGIDPCPTLEELRAGVPTAEAPTSARAGTPAPAPETTTTSVATTSTVEAPRLAEPDVCSAPGTCPDFGTALAGDDGVGPLPLGSVGDVPNQHRLDFLFRVCDRRRCSLDAHFMDPENAERGASPWSAGEPFHVRHGFANPGAEPLGEGFSVAMYVSRQGADRDDPPEVTEAAAAGFEPGEVYEFTPDYVLRGTSDRCGPTFETQSDPVTCEWFVHDFPDGLPAGRFTLWAVWEAPCAAWIDLGLADSCTDPAEVISRFSSSVNSPFGDFPQEYDHERD